LVELDRLLEQALLAVDLHAREALLAELLEDVPVLAFPVADDRRVDGETRPFRQPQHLVDDLLDALAGDRAAADRAVGPAHARVEQTQVVVDLRDGADRRARVPRRRLLVDRDRRAEPVDVVDVGLLHHLQELPRVGGQRLDVAALALRVDRVEGEARLARSREHGDADQGVPGQPNGDVLEVVLPRAVDDELVCRHGAQSTWANRRSGTPRRARRPRERSYLPVLTYWTQSPWFLKVEPSARVRVCQPLPLQSSLLVGALIVDATTRIAGWKPVQQPASSRNVPAPPTPPSQYS